MRLNQVIGSLVRFMHLAYASRLSISFIHLVYASGLCILFMHLAGLFAPMQNGSRVRVKFLSG